MMEDTNGKLHLIYIGLDDDGMPWVSPDVITAKLNDEVKLISKYDFEIEFFGRTPENAQERFLRKKYFSRDGVIPIKVDESYRTAQAKFANYPQYFQKTLGGKSLPCDIAKAVRDDFPNDSLSDDDIMDIIKKAPMERPEDFFFIYFNVKIGCHVIDPGMGIDPK